MAESISFFIDSLLSKMATTIFSLSSFYGLICDLTDSGRKSNSSLCSVIAIDYYIPMPPCANTVSINLIASFGDNALLINLT